MQNLSEIQQLIKRSEHNFVLHYVNFVNTSKELQNELAIESACILSALEIAYEHEMWEELIKGTISFYKFLETRGRYETAEGLLRRTEYAAELLNKQKPLAKTCLYLGTIAERRGNYEQAQRYFDKGYELARQLGDNETLLFCLQSLGAVATLSGRYKQAECLLLDALEIAQRLHNDKGISKILSNLGATLLKQGNYKSAQEYFRRGLKLAIKMGDKKRISLLLVNSGVVAEHKGDYGQAKKLYQQGLDTARQINYFDIMSLALMNLGIIADNEGNKIQAEKYWLEGLVIAEEIGYLERISLLRANLGWLEIGRKRYKEGRTHIQIGLNAARTNSNPSNICALLQAFGALEIECGEINKAEDWLKEGEIIARKINDGFRLITNLYWQGKFYLKQQNLQLAFEAFTESLELAQKHHLKLYMAYTLFGLAEVAYSEINVDEAYQKGEESLLILEEIRHEYASNVRDWLAKLEKDHSDL